MSEDFTTCFLTDEQKNVWGPILRAHGIFPHSPEDGLAFFCEKEHERAFFAECKNAERIEEQLLGPDIMALDEVFNDQLREEVAMEYVLRQRSKRGDRLTRTEQIKANKAAKKKLTNTYCQSKPWGMLSHSERHSRSNWGYDPGKEDRLRNQSVINEQLLEMAKDAEQAVADGIINDYHEIDNLMVDRIRQTIKQAHSRILELRSLMMPESNCMERSLYGSFNQTLKNDVIELKAVIETLEDGLEIYLAIPDSAPILEWAPTIGREAKLARRKRAKAKRLRGLNTAICQAWHCFELISYFTFEYMEHEYERLAK